LSSKNPRNPNSVKPVELQAAKLRQIFQSYYYQGQKYGKNADYDP
jgi:hypothetical protein